MSIYIILGAVLYFLIGFFAAVQYVRMWDDDAGVEFFWFFFWPILGLLRLGNCAINETAHWLDDYQYERDKRRGSTKE